MKKFGRQAQYYKNSKSIENLNNNNLYENQQWSNDLDYDDPVDLEFINQFQQIPNPNLNSSTKKSNNKKINKDIYKTPKFNSTKSNKSSSYFNKNNSSSTYVKYFRLSEINDNTPYNCLDISQLAS